MICETFVSMKSLISRLAILVLASTAMVAQQPAAAAQPQAPTATQSITPLKWRGLTFSGSLRVRTEAWDWFEGNAENTYPYVHELFRLQVTRQTERADFGLEIAVPAILGLPEGAVAPGAQGALGLGGNYYTANGNNRNSVSIFPKQAYVRFKNLGSDKNTLTFGRFEFVEGGETTLKDGTLAALKRDRIAHRLLGTFAFSAVGRSFDGVQFSHGGKQNVTVAALRPTRGVFQADGLGSLDIGVLYGAYTAPVAGKNVKGELRVFALGYDDERPLVKTDNRPVAVRNLDRDEVQVATIGGNYIQVADTGIGKIDTVLWGVYQFGNWGVQDHRAAAAVAEIGWQPKTTVLKPWLRAGYSYGSGDGDPNDGKHNTFFQTLPTPRLYARFPFYNMQNNQDAYGILILRPTKKLSLRSDLHALRLANSNDLWYQGGGAFQARSFGYVGRPSGGSRGLAYLWDISADYQVNARVGVTAYFANAWGKSVIKNIYPEGQTGRFGYLELNYKF